MKLSTTFQQDPPM